MDNQKRTYFIGSLAVAVVVAIVIWFACAGRTSIHDLRNEADAVRTELNNATESQRAEADTLRRASEATERSAGAVENSQRTVEEISRIERTDAELIREGRSILERVRARGGAEDKN